jgi:diguanylate cyclase (GGDEF)-like protein
MQSSPDERLAGQGRRLPRPPDGVVWGFPAVCAVLLVVAYASLPRGLAADVVWQAVTFGAACCVAIGMRVHRPEDDRAWRVIRGSLLLIALAGLVGAESFGIPEDQPAAAVTPLLYLLAYLGLGWGSVECVHTLLPAGDRAALLDGAIVMVALLTVLWGTALTSLDADALTGAQQATLVVMSLVPAWVLSMNLRLLFVTGFAVPSAWLLATAGAIALGVNTSFAVLLSNGATRSPVWVNVLWMVGLACVALAALHPSMRRLARRADAHDDVLPFARLAVLGLALVAPPVLLLLAGQQEGREAPAMLGSALVSILVCWRFAGVVRHQSAVKAQLRTRADRQASLSALAEQALRDVPHDDFVAAIEQAVTTHLPGHVGTYVSTDRSGRGVVMGFQLTPVAGAHRRHGFLLAEGGSEVEGEDADFLRTLAALLAGFLDRHEADRVMRHRALHDDLTGLPNRALLLERLDRAIVRRRREGQPVGLLFVDLDGFKRVNDTIGHAAGDDLLREVTGRLGDEVRRDDTLARLAGDEFVVLLDDVDRPDALDMGTRLLDALQQPFSIAGRRVTIGASVGFAMATDDLVHPDELLQQADWVMYEAKAAGRNQLREFDDCARRAYAHRHDLTADPLRS